MYTVSPFAYPGGYGGYGSQYAAQYGGQYPGYGYGAPFPSQIPQYSQYGAGYGAAGYGLPAFGGASTVYGGPQFGGYPGQFPAGQAGFAGFGGAAGFAGFPGTYTQSPATVTTASQGPIPQAAQQSQQVVARESQAAPQQQTQAPQQQQQQQQANHKVVVIGSAQGISQNREEVVRRVKKLQDAARKEAGCAEYNWTQSIDDPNKFIIFELWDSEQNLQAHLDSEHVKEFKQVVPDLFVSDPQVQKSTVAAFEEI